jgi:hypothetical protein
MSAHFIVERPEGEYRWRASLISSDGETVSERYGEKPIDALENLINHFVESAIFSMKRKEQPK